MSFRYYIDEEHSTEKIERYIRVFTKHSDRETFICTDTIEGKTGKAYIDFISLEYNKNEIIADFSKIDPVYDLSVTKQELPEDITKKYKSLFDLFIFNDNENINEFKIQVVAELLIVYKAFADYFVENPQKNNLNYFWLFVVYLVGENSHLYEYTPELPDYSTHVAVFGDRKKALYDKYRDDKASGLKVYLDNTIYDQDVMSKIEKYYLCPVFSSVLLVSLYELIKAGYLIKKCRNCGKYFVPYSRSDTIYCDRTSPQDDGKTCKEYGKYINYLHKTQNDEATRLYKQIYNKRKNRLKRGTSIKLIKELDEFRKQADQWRKEVKAGSKPESEYIEWLKKEKAVR